MPRQYSLAHLTALACTPPELVRVAGAAGYQFVGLRLMPLGLPEEPRFDFVADRALRRETAAALAATGVKVLDVELARILDGVNPERYLPAMEAGANLGARHVLSSIWTSDAAFVVDAFGTLCDLAKPLGLTVDLEFVAWGSVSTLAGVLDVVHAVGRPNAGVMIDTFHFHHAGTRPAELDVIPRDWLHYAHVGDDRADGRNGLEDCKRHGREARLHPGEGEIDVAGILQHLPEDVVCAIEQPHLERMRTLGVAAYVRECLVRTRGYLERC